MGPLLLETACYDHPLKNELLLRNLKTWASLLPPEAVVSAIGLAESAAHEGGEEGPEVDAEVEYAEGIRALGSPFP
jgi:hypothetical protein